MKERPDINLDSVDVNTIGVNIAIKSNPDGSYVLQVCVCVLCTRTLSKTHT